MEGFSVADVVALGECMLEVGLLGRAQAALGYAGDTFNAAVYLQRLGRSTAYATAIGSGDPFSAGMLDLMRDEGVDVSLVRQLEGRLPGAYAIDRDAQGERRFFYWRDEAPARDYMAVADLAALRQAMMHAKLIYISGVTLAIFGEDGRARLGELLTAAQAAGAQVAFDPNHRPQLWDSCEQAQAAIDAVTPLCRYISVGVSDLQTLYGDAGPAEDWAAKGAEVVLRAENHAVTVFSGAEVIKLSPEPPVRALDTTGAGDAFNAGYLWARLDGRDPRAAVRIARRLANFVVQHIGAIIPRAAMQAAQADATTAAGQTR
jgi:2-dehydro-3-deoxygluconokinase